MGECRAVRWWAYLSRPPEGTSSICIGWCSDLSWRFVFNAAKAAGGNGFATWREEANGNLHGFVAVCHCTLSMARRAVFIVVNFFVVFSDWYGNAGDSAVWTVRPRATVRKPLFPGAKLVSFLVGNPLSHKINLEFSMEKSGLLPTASASAQSWEDFHILIRSLFTNPKKLKRRIIKESKYKWSYT